MTLSLLYVLEQAVEWLFPARAEIRALERMEPELFLLEVRRPIDGLPAVSSLFDYDCPIVRTAIWALKYEGNKRIGRLLASLLYDSILERLSDEILFYNFTEPILIPLPLSSERRRDRGWNQTEILAKELEVLDRNKNFVICLNALRKNRHTVAQTKLSREDRIKNLKGCFEVTDQVLVRNKNIILIDDVATTGSTIAEATKTLEKAGAKRVIAFTVAH